MGTRTFHCIVSNPPYIPHGTKLAPDLSFEPEGALFSNDDGLSDLLIIIDGARINLEVGGKLFLECGEGQWAVLQSNESIRRDFEMVAHCDLQGIERVLELTKIQ
jgi:release factor glutamine methyltransferase